MATITGLYFRTFWNFFYLIKKDCYLCVLKTTLDGKIVWSLAITPKTSSQ